MQKIPMKKPIINHHTKETNSKLFHTSMNMQVSHKLKAAKFPRIYKWSQTNEVNGTIKGNDSILHDHKSIISKYKRW